MANHKSALKRARQNEKRRARNNSLRSVTKSAVRRALELITSSSTRDDALKALSSGAKALEKAVSKGVWPKNRASRKISRLAQTLNKKFAPSASKSA